MKHAAFAFASESDTATFAPIALKSDVSINFPEQSVK